jgi:steroid 5-alpha reductase family enzyme
MTSEIWTMFGINLAVMLVVMTLIAIPSFTTRDPSYIDAFWGIGFVIIATSSFVQGKADGFGDSARQGVLLGLCAFWGLRLGSYLLWRWRKNGPDPRYQQILATRKSGSEKVFIWRRVFIVQAFVLTTVALPVQLGMIYDRPVGLTWWNWVGAGIALFGILFESTADFQLARFKADPASHGHVMDKGLWHNTRHPNYFGEACTWWGLGLVAWCNAVTVLALLGPLVITFFLLKVSGVGLLESSMKKSKPKYVDYIASTSAFVPLPKRDAAKVKAEAGIS